MTRIQKSELRRRGHRKAEEARKARADSMYAAFIERQRLADEAKTQHEAERRREAYMAPVQQKNAERVQEIIAQGGTGVTRLRPAR